MILTPFAVLAIFVGLVEFCLAAAVVRAAAGRLRRRHTTPASEPEGDATARPALARLLLLAFALLVASVASWPLLYGLLESYVPQWAGVVCIEGVTRIGTDAEGPAHWLPGLLGCLAVLKPALVFASGAWLALHLADRTTRTSPLAGRTLTALLVTGCLAVVDAGAELAYVAIPKQERFLARGCCVVPTELVDRASSMGAPREPRAAPASTTPVVAGFGALAAALVAGSFTLRRRTQPGDRPTGPASDALALAALASLPIGALFARTVVAPALLGLPDHRCFYCLDRSPLALLAVVAWVVGAFCAAWAGVVARFASHPETGAAISAGRRRLLGTAGVSFVVALGLVAFGLLRT